MTMRHTDREFENELQQLRERLLLMAGRVEQMIAASVKALVERDLDQAARTIAADQRVNLDEMETDELCLEILARRQPMASDLRFIALALKMVTDLERIGDLAVNVCERVIDLGTDPPIKPYEDIPVLATLVQSMVRDAVDALVERDAVKARSVVGRDGQVDRLYSQVFRHVLDVMLVDNTRVQPGIHLQSVCKYLERMADHATNLAEEVVFLVEGRDIRHVGKLPPEANE
jgi:phosphate transport system protein